MRKRITIILILFFISTVTLVFIKYLQHNKEINSIEASSKIAQDISNLWNTGVFKKSVKSESFIESKIYNKYSQYNEILKSELSNKKFYISDYTKGKFDDINVGAIIFDFAIPKDYTGDPQKYVEEKQKDIEENPDKYRRKPMERTHTNDDPRVKYDRLEDKYYILTKDLDFSGGFDIVDYYDSSFEIKPEDTPMNYDYIIKNSNRHYNYVSQNTKEVDDHTEVTYFYKDTINKDNFLKIVISFNKKGILDFEVKY